MMCNGAVQHIEWCSVVQKGIRFIYNVGYQIKPTPTYIMYIPILCNQLYVHSIAYSCIHIYVMLMLKHLFWSCRAK